MNSQTLSRSIAPPAAKFPRRHDRSQLAAQLALSPFNSQANSLREGRGPSSNINASLPVPHRCFCNLAITQDAACFASLIDTFDSFPVARQSDSAKFPTTSARVYRHLTFMSQTQTRWRLLTHHNMYGLLVLPRECNVFIFTTFQISLRPPAYAMWLFDSWKKEGTASAITSEYARRKYAPKENASITYKELNRNPNEYCHVIH